MATVAAVVSEVASKLSSKAKILTDSADEGFKVALERWSDINKKTPGAIVCAVSENDVLITVSLVLSIIDSFFNNPGLSWYEFQNLQILVWCQFSRSDADYHKKVQSCIQHNVKFVAKAGGHSQWATIGAEGIIIDLSQFNETKIDKEAQTVTFQCGAIAREVIAALAAAELCCGK